MKTIIKKSEFLPSLQENKEEHVLQNYEITYLSGYFDTMFKLSPIIVNAILEKYDTDTIDKFKEMTYFSKQRNELISCIKKCKEKCTEKDITWSCIKEYNANTEENQNLDKLIYEISILSEKVDFLRDVHPFTYKDKHFKENYVEILVMYASRELTSMQVFRIEEIARQLNVKSDALLELFEKYTKNKSADKQIVEKIKSLEDLEEKTILVDIISLDIFRFSKPISKFIKKVNKNKNLIYSVQSRLIEIL